MSTTEKHTHFFMFQRDVHSTLSLSPSIMDAESFRPEINQVLTQTRNHFRWKTVSAVLWRIGRFSRICRSFSACFFFCVRLFCLLHVNWKQNKKKMEKSSRCPRSDDRGHGTSHCGSSLRMIRSNSFNDAALSIVPVKLNIQTSKMNKKCDYWMHNEPQHEKKKQNHFSHDFTAAPFGWDKSLSNGPTLNQIQTNALRIIHRL